MDKLHKSLQGWAKSRIIIFMAIPHNSKCRYGERGAADAKPKAQIILDAAKVSAASGGNSEPKQGQRSQSARGFCPRSTMRVPQPDIIEHFGNADAVPQPPKRCLSRKAGIVRCCPKALCLTSCLCLRNIRHFLWLQIHLNLSGQWRVLRPAGRLRAGRGSHISSARPPRNLPAHRAQ